MTTKPCDTCKKLQSQLAQVLAALEAWQRYAVHQETCAVCAESVGSCIAGSFLAEQCFALAPPAEKGESNATL